MCQLKINKLRDRVGKNPGTGSQLAAIQPATERMTGIDPIIEDTKTESPV